MVMTHLDYFGLNVMLELFVNWELLKMLQVKQLYGMGCKIPFDVFFCSKSNALYLGYLEKQIFYFKNPKNSNG